MRLNKALSALVLPLALNAATSARLQDQSIALEMDRAFADARVSYLLLDASDARIIAERWFDPETPVPVGSLLKPFAAMAYGDTHRQQFPRLMCKGATGQCWRPRGHGALDLPHAIAYSCNAYFLALAKDIDPSAIAAIAQRFGLAKPTPAADASAYIGIGAAWRVAPQALARAYCELSTRATDSELRSILTGMALSATSGTGRGVGSGAYAKTGTAPCIHSPKQPGDGYAIALWPIESPRYALLVSVDGAPGAQAASVCGRMRALIGTQPR